MTAPQLATRDALLASGVVRDAASLLKQMRTLAHEAGWDAGIAFVGVTSLAAAWDEGAEVARRYRDDLDLSPLNPYRAEAS